MNDYFYSRLYWGTHSKPRRAEFSLEHKIKLSAVLDEEIHGLACTVSAVLKENIVTARLELRMNDDAYPLSVVYREFIKNLL